MKNKIIKQDKEITILQLNNNQELIIDTDDYNLIKDAKWNAAFSKKTNSYYCRTNKNNSKTKFQSIYIHRIIMNIKDPKIKVDHINHNTLDNRKSNLRLSTNTQNSCNRKMIKGQVKYHGVYLHKEVNKYVAMIRIGNSKRLYLGSFVCSIDAAKAYDEAAKKYHGEFATLNFK